jgi:hypothetical protein
MVSNFRPLGESSFVRQSDKENVNLIIPFDRYSVVLVSNIN